jgi:hypothetical protein
MCVQGHWRRLLGLKDTEIKVLMKDMEQLSLERHQAFMALMDERLKPKRLELPEGLKGPPRLKEAPEAVCSGRPRVHVGGKKTEYALEVHWICELAEALEIQI